MILKVVMIVLLICVTYSIFKYQIFGAESEYWGTIVGFSTGCFCSITHREFKSKGDK